MNDNLDKAMELEKLKKQLEDKDRIIHEKDAVLEDMAHKLSETKKELLAKTLAVQLQEPQLLICNSRQRESTSSPSTELVSKPSARKTSSMGMPPMMGGESPSEVVSASGLRLVLLGKREDKQAIAEAILGRDIVVPQTQWSERRQAEVAQRTVTMVDTPDWFSPAFSQSLRQDVRQCMELSSPGPHVFLLVVPVDALEGEQGSIPDKMEDIFGETCWEYTMILFTSTEEMGLTRMEEFIDRNQDLQQLVKRCGERYHCFDLRACDSNVSFLRTIDKVMSGNSGGFYESQMYLEAEAQYREMESKMQQEKEQRKEKRKRAEKEMAQLLEKTVEASLRKVKEQIRGHEGEIQSLHERMSSLERERKEEKNEGKIRDIDEELERESAKRKELEEKMSALKNKSEKERKEMEEKHKSEMEELRERYKREARADKEKNIMKMLLSDYYKRIRSAIPMMENHFIPLLGGLGQMKSLIPINKNNTEGESESQGQDNQRQMEKMCMEMANLSQALLEKVRGSAEKHQYRTSKE